MEKWFCLAAGGVLGTLARFAMTGAVMAKTGAQFPYGTMAVNMLGCFLVGFFDVLTERKCAMSPQVRLFLMAGFCGAFTTFSAFILESYTLARSGEMFRAFIYIFGSVALGLVFFRLGIFLGGRL